MAIWKALTTAGVRVFFGAAQNGVLRTGLLASDFTALLLEPGDTASTAITISESTQKPGLYYGDLPSSFLADHGSGQYGFLVGINATGPTLNAQELYSIEVNQQAINNVILNSIADGLLDRPSGIEAGITHRQALRGIAALLFGAVSGGPGNPSFRRVGGGQLGTVRVTITAGSTGNRTSITLNL